MVLMQRQLVLGPEPGTDTHGLVGASGRGALTLPSRRRGAVASTIATAMVLTLRCWHAPALLRGCRSDIAAFAVTWHCYIAPCTDAVTRVSQVLSPP